MRLGGGGRVLNIMVRGWGIPIGPVKPPATRGQDLGRAVNVKYCFEHVLVVFPWSIVWWIKCNKGRNWGQ